MLFRSATMQPALGADLALLGDAMGAAAVAGAAVPLVAQVQAQLAGYAGQWPGQLQAIASQLQSLAASVTSQTGA